MNRFILITTLGLFSLTGIDIPAQLPEVIGVFRSDTSNTLFGSQIVALGDQNNDGFDDFIIWDGRPNAYLYYGGNPPLDVRRLQFNTVLNRVSPIGDVNGDSYIDFVVNGRNPALWRLNLYYGGPNADTVRDLWFGQDTIRPTGFAVNGMDINANGNPEIILNNHLNQTIYFLELGSDSDSIPDFALEPPNLESNEYGPFGEGIAAGDFDGDGFVDLAVNLRFSPSDSLVGRVLLYWGGPQFDTIPDLIIPRSSVFEENFDLFGQVLENLGDVNGDGYDDLYIESGNSSQDTVGLIYFCGPSIDSLPDVTIPDRTGFGKSVGDLNNDGYMDLITSYPIQSSSAGRINIYFGGPQMDSIADIQFRTPDMPEFMILMGMDATGVGDVNNDGFDDFAVSGVDLNGKGVVYILAGSDLSTDVEIIHDPVLPGTFTLKQNYPNPFNPETTIEFTLTRRAHATLIIYNTLGQRIRTLADEPLSAGAYRVIWDGSDDKHKQVASGMYYYELKVGNSFAQSKKMILLK